jgi:Uma2 family endonuclease
VVIEIVSPESIGRDRGDKLVEYERAGVKEYWLLDPDRQSAEFYELGADGLYHMARIDDGVYRSRVISGFWLRVDWLWMTPLPPTLDLLRELGVV